VTDPAHDIPSAAMARFTAAEARLYPMAVTDPDGYARATTLVGIVADQLRRSCPDVATLQQRRAELITDLPDLAAAAGLSVADLPADAVVDAASALRCRELQAAGAARVRRERIEAARAAGTEWLVDEADPAEVMSGSYRRVETHVPSGSTLLISTESGTVGAGPTYAIEVVRHGVTTATPSTQRWVYDDREAWLVAANDIRSELSGAS
jgi:hypothetical protein